MSQAVRVLQLGALDSFLRKGAGARYHFSMSGVSNRFLTVLISAARRCIPIHCAAAEVGRLLLDGLDHFKWS